MTIEQTLAERGKRYGDFADRAKLSQQLQDVMRDADGFHVLTAVQKQSLTVIADKISRILTGDANHADSWHDIQGYAKLAEDRIPADPVAANDNARPYRELPPGFLPFNLYSDPVPKGSVSDVFLRNGITLSASECPRPHWDTVLGDQEREIIGYRLND